MTTETSESMVVGQSQLYERWYRNNNVRTNKYTKYNFLPLNLFVQFSKVANIYFLFICAMQCIKTISISQGRPATALPLAFVVFASMAKDAWEDYQRYKADNEENNYTAHVYDPTT